MSTLQIILSSNILLQICLFGLSLKKLRDPQYRPHTVLPLYIFTAFVWEDMLVFSLLGIIASMLLIYLNSGKLALILLLLFLIFRWGGEVIYWFLQQFGPKKSRPFDFGFKNLGNNEIYIIYQVANMSLAVLASFFLYLAIQLQ